MRKVCRVVVFVHFDFNIPFSVRHKTDKPWFPLNNLTLTKYFYLPLLQQQHLPLPEVPGHWPEYRCQLWSPEPEPAGCRGRLPYGGWRGDDRRGQTAPRGSSGGGAGVRHLPDGEMGLGETQDAQYEGDHGWISRQAVSGWDRAINWFLILISINLTTNIAM